MLRDVRRLCATPDFCVREPLHASQWGNAVMMPLVGHDAQAEFSVSPFTSPEDRKEWIRLQKLLRQYDGLELIEIVRTKFREGITATNPIVSLTDKTVGRSFIFNRVMYIYIYDLMNDGYR